MWVACRPLTLSLTLSLSLSLSKFISPSIPAIHHIWLVLKGSSDVRSELTDIFAGQPALICQCVGVHYGTSLLSSRLLLQPRLAYLAQLIWVVCEIRGKRQYSCCFIECCFQFLFKKKTKSLGNVFKIIVSSHTQTYRHIHVRIYTNTQV